MDISEYRATPSERARISDLFNLVPTRGARAIDVGTRDGYLARLLADRCNEVVALDLEEREIHHPRIQSVKGNAASLEFPDHHFDVVVCAEVLEHIPPKLLSAVCRELIRVCRGAIVIGVPYRQDLRYGRTRCALCNQLNPPWGHVNSFDEAKLRALFSGTRIDKVTFVGATNVATNWLSVALLDFAGNPFGTWEQEESCIYCRGAIGRPSERNILQRLASRAAVVIQQWQSKFSRPRAKWIHVRIQPMHDDL